MKVIANKDFADLITEGREYETLGEIGNFYKIENNLGTVLKYPKSIFDVVKPKPRKSKVQEVVESDEQTDE